MDIQTEVSAVSALAVSPDGRYLLTVDNGGTLTASDFGVVRMWDLVEGRQVFKKANTLKLASAVAISPDGRYAVTGGETRPFLSNRGVRKEMEQEQYALNVWDLTTGTIVQTFAGFKGPNRLVYDIKFSRDGRYFLAKSVSEIYVFDTASWRAIRKFPGSRFGGGADFSPDGKRILTSDSGGLFHLWEIATSKKIWTIQAHKSGIMGLESTAIAFTPDGKSVLTGSGFDGTVRLWDAANGKLLREFAGYKVAQYGVSGVNGLALSPDGTQFMVLAQPLKIVEVKTGKEVTDLSAAWKGQQAVYSGNALSGAFHPDGKRVLLNLSDSAVRMYDAATGEETAMFVGFADGEWLVITKEGYYNASEKGAQYLSVVVGNQGYGVDKFYDVFYRPDIVAVKLQGEDISGLATVSMTDAIKSPPPLVDLTYQGDAGRSKARICYQVKSTGGGIGEVRLFHNGKLIQSDGYYREAAKSSLEQTQLASLNSKAIYDDMRSVTIKDKAQSVPATIKPKGETFADCGEIDPVAGENEVSVAAFNAGNTIQSSLKTVHFNSGVKFDDPHLYILSIGIDRYRDENINLKYAAKDAQDLEEKIKTQSATLYKPQNIHYSRLTDGEATKASIIGKIDDLARVIKPGDSFILFVAGHGVLLQNQYYVLTHDFNGQVSDMNVISSNEIVEMSKKIKSLSQLLIFDTCHAGGVDYIISGLYDARMSVLAKKMGLHIYASANDKQAAMDGYQGNGLFTHVLLDGLNNNREADRNKDGEVTVVGLGEYSKKMTASISREIGHSQTPLIINFGKDSALYKLK
ncbi:MAG: caspase family protein [Deltaproteobacteria bacterium]|nr:caspase family protein [Deltaproteobacteria bacterium]